MTDYILLVYSIYYRLLILKNYYVLIVLMIHYCNGSVTIYKII